MCSRPRGVRTRTGGSRVIREKLRFLKGLVRAIPVRHYRLNIDLGRLIFWV